MNALLILAHGSRKKRSNDEVQSLAQRYEVAYPDQFDAVYAGFMELAQPDIHMTIRTAIDAGATQLTILPYFLAAGAHVVDDIPQIVESAMADYPDMKHRILPHVGGADGMVGLINQLCSDIN